MSSTNLEPSEPGGMDRRRFTLLDLMVLIAAFAVCWMVPKTFRRLSRRKPTQFTTSASTPRSSGASWLVSASVALAVLVIFVPKPGGRERFRQPGALAMLMVAFTWVYDVIQTAIQGGMLWLTTGQSFSDGGFWYLFGPIYDVSFRAVLAVMASWITLALLGLGRPESNWLDRSGRILGWIWVVWGLLAWVLEYQTIVRHNTALSL